jgi:hypothetical protein
MSDTPSTGGGSAGRRGFVFQDVATAYFSLTDYPDFLQKYPTEFYIEKPSDFLMKIEFDEFNDVHYFEVKSVDEGNYTWGSFKSDVLPKLTELAKEEADSNNKNSYHLVSNNKLERFFKNTQKLRDGRIQWPHLKNLYEKRNVDQIKKHSSLEEEEELASVVARLFGHSVSMELLIKKLEEYIKRCNSPGQHQKDTRLLLQKIHEKDDGVLRRVDLENELGVSLRTREDSTDAESTDDLTDMLENAEDLQSEMQPENVDVNEVRSWRSFGSEFMNVLSDRNDVDTDMIDSMQTSYDERMGELEDVKEREEELRMGAGRELDRAIDIADDVTGTDNTDTDV